jgi:hypothetical protein
LIKHDSVSQGDLFFEFLEIFLAVFHLTPLSNCC